MYEHYGDDFLLRMRGMFALAVYDKRRGPGRERLLLARDQMGIKPLLYAKVRGGVVFASEVKALLASGLVERNVDAESLRLLLTYGSVYQPRTILKGVNMLLPAHRLIIDQRGERIEQYWSLGINRQKELRTLPYKEQVQQVAALLSESVRLQMVSDVPLGAFLSGGLDSALLVALMTRQTSARQVKTFSVGFEHEGSEIDETRDAARTARFLGTDHARIVVRGDDVRDRIGHIAYGLDQPSVDGVNSYFVSLAARKAVTVAISGTGGDELFAGYPWFAQVARQEDRWSTDVRWKRIARKTLAPAVRAALFNSTRFSLFRERIDQLRYTTDFRTRYVTTYRIFSPDEASSLISSELRGSTFAGQSPYFDLAFADELPHGSTIERVTGTCLRGYTNNQLLRDIDAVSMSHSLEVRVPFLDPVIADAALSLPDLAKLSGSIESWHTRMSYREAGTKRILLDIAAELLPPGFDTSPKRGFAMPFSTWLRGPLKEILQDTLSPQVTKERGLLDPVQAKAVQDAFFLGSIDWAQPWLLMMIELWLREVADAPAPRRNYDEHQENRVEDVRTAVV